MMKRELPDRGKVMSRRFRPFYVAAVAVVMVGLFGIRVVPKSHTDAAAQDFSVQSVSLSGDDSGWLGPYEVPASGLLNLAPSLSILPFDIAQ
jgi:hypothetical protein